MLINYCYAFAAFMINHMTWGGDDAESFLEVDVKLNLTLEVVLIPHKIYKYCVYCCML